jgi:hypothetical protein
LHCRRQRKREQLEMRFPQSIVLIVAVTGALAACHPRDHSEHSGQPESTQPQQVGQAEGQRGGRGLRRICADDIAKYCQNDDRKRRCLRQNMDKLSADCKAAVEAARGHKRNNGNSAQPENED